LIHEGSPKKSFTVDCFKTKPLRPEMGKKLWQNHTDLVDRFQAVVKNDYRTTLRMFQDVLQTLIGRDAPMKIVTQYRPKDKPEILSQ